MVYLEKFILPDEEEEYSIARKRMEETEVLSGISTTRIRAGSLRRAGFASWILKG